MMGYIVKAAFYISLGELLCPVKYFCTYLSAPVYVQTTGAVAKGWLVNAL